jgi:hypothetical protein
MWPPVEMHSYLDSRYSSTVSLNRVKIPQISILKKERAKKVFLNTAIYMYR